MSSELPLQRFPLVHTFSLQVAAQLQSTINSRMLAEQADRKADFEWQANRLVVGELAIVASRYGAGVRGKTDNVDGMYSLLVAQRGGALSTQANQSVVLAAGRRAALLSPGMPAQIELCTDYRGLSVRIPQALMETTLDVLCGVQRGRPLRFEGCVDLEQGAGADCLRLLMFMIGEAEREESVLRAPIVESRLSEAFVSSLLLGLPHNHSHLLRSPQRSSEPRYVRRAQEFLEANAHRRVTAAEVARAAGVSMRTLSAAFKAHRGISAFGFLREQRLELSRARLLAAAAETVAEVAVASGFEHLGRFSAEYGRRYRESPAQTLRRARMASAAHRPNARVPPK
jgi:AraC-like DNA-binding protein